MARTPNPTPGGTDVFPTLHCCTQLNTGARLYDVKFYPFPTANDEQIFAVAGSKDIFICRITPNSNPPYEIIRWFKDKEAESDWNSVAWTTSPTTGKPWLCAAGSQPKQVQVLDVESQEIVRTLGGHGRGINDLVISPLSNNLLFSAGEDYTIRIWNLDPEYEDQPCVGLFAGEGHRQPILTICIHPNGRWMLSGGLDTAVCLWSVPSADELARDPSKYDKDHHPEPKLIYYPYFHSTEVHHNFVDCVRFHGDLIISRAARDPMAADAKTNEILIWKICGFDPDDQPPSEPPVPSAGVYTRSSFQQPKSSRGFQRLLTLDLPLTDRFYQRFGLLQSPNMRPILAMGNQESKMLFWDLQKFEEGLEPGEERDRMKKARSARGGKRGARGGGGAKAAPKSTANDLNRLEGLRRENSSFSDTQSVPSAGTVAGSRETPQDSSTSHSTHQERKYELSDPFESIAAHHTKTLNTKLSKASHFGTSAVAFSPDGTWMIGVGDNGMMNIFHRDASVV